MNLVFFYVDMGSPWWPHAAKAMCASARKVIPGVKLVQMTDRKTEPCPDADEVRAADEDCVSQNMMQFRGMMAAMCATHAEVNTILCDCDLIWKKDPTEVFQGDFDIGLLWRPEMISQPYNMGIVYTKPTEGARRFWRAYFDVVSEMKGDMCAWWGDQLSMALCVGLGHAAGETVQAFGAKVKLFDMHEHAPVPPKEGYATHFKGRRKDEMFA